MDKLPDVLRSVDGPYALAGLALLVVGVLFPRLVHKRFDQATRRVVSISLLVLGGITIVGSLVLAAKTSTDVDAASRDPHSISVHGQGNTVGNGNVVGNGNTIQQAER